MAFYELYSQLITKIVFFIGIIGLIIFMVIWGWSIIIDIAEWKANRERKQRTKGKDEKQ